MDTDFWSARLAAVKRQYAFQNSRLDGLNMEDVEVEEEVRPDFPCPYCYEDFDIVSLCSHLQDDHSCDSRVTVCPICSSKVVQDMLSHITLQHGHLFKLQRRHRFRRVAIPNSQAFSALGRDLREAHLHMQLGGGGFKSNTSNVSNAATDPFLSSLILNYPASESNELSKSVATSMDESSAKNSAPTHIWKSSFDPSLTYEERQKRLRQATGRSGFVQDLLLSTLLDD